MAQKIRRYVTGRIDQGKSVILFDDLAPNANEIKSWPGLALTEVWVSNEMPVDNNGRTDQSLRPTRHDPTPNGTIDPTAAHTR